MARSRLRDLPVAAAESPNMPSRPVGARHAVALLEGAPADGVEHELDAAPVGQLAHAHLEVVAGVVDAGVEAEGLQPLVLAGRGRAEDARAGALRELDRRDADAAAGRVDEHGVAGVRSEPITCRSCHAVR